DRRDIVELRPVPFEEALADLARDLLCLRGAGSDGESHQEMRGMAELWCMPLVPLVLEAPRHALDLTRREQLFAIMRTTGIEDEAGFGGQIRQLGAQLRPGMAAALPDRLEDRWGMAARRADHLCPFAKAPGGRARNLAPAA